MTDNHQQVPRAAVRGIAFGIFLMALFTTMWLGIASSVLSGLEHWLCLSVLFIILIWFVAYAAALLKKAKEFPVTKPDDIAEGVRIQKWYGIIFGLEGLVIGATCAILGAKGLGIYIVPAIALIVGLHFYPMVIVFNRKFDYITGTWTTVLATLTLLLLAKKMITEEYAFLMVGIGVAIATISYGIFMMSEAEKYKARLK